MNFEDEDDGGITDWMNLPIYKKAMEIVETVHALMNLIQDEIGDQDSCVGDTEPTMLSSCTRDMFVY
jgi:hypothetical protein